MWCQALTVLRSPAPSDGGRPPGRESPIFGDKYLRLEYLRLADMENLRRTPTQPSMASRLLSTFESAGLAATATFASVVWIGLALPGLPLLPGLGGGQNSNVAISLNSAVLGVQDSRTFTPSIGTAGRQARLLSLLLPAPDPLGKDLATKQPDTEAGSGAPMVVALPPAPPAQAAAHDDGPRVIESTHFASAASPAPPVSSPPPPRQPDPKPQTPAPPALPIDPPPPTDPDASPVAGDTPPSDGSSPDTTTPPDPGSAPGNGNGNGNGNAGGNNPNAGGDNPSAGGANAGGNGNGNGNAGGNNPNAGGNNPNAGGANAGGNGNGNGAGNGAPKGPAKKGQ